MTSLEYLRSWVGQEYKPCDLLFGIDKIWNWISDGVTGLKKNESSGELDFLRYSVKGRSAGGNLNDPSWEKEWLMLDTKCQKAVYRGTLIKWQLLQSGKYPIATVWKNSDYSLDSKAAIEDRSVDTFRYRDHRQQLVSSCLHELKTKKHLCITFVSRWN